MGKKKYILLLSVFLLLLTGYVLVKPAFKYLTAYLSKSTLVKSNILIVEGWLPDYALEEAREEFFKGDYDRICTTGLKFVDNYCMLSQNGYLVFYPKNQLSGDRNTGLHSIEISASSELGGENKAHFNFYINDSLKADFIAEKKKSKYLVHWKGDLNEIDSLLVQFTNDGVGDYGDRNLYVKEIIIDNKIILKYRNQSEYDMGALDGKYRLKNNYSSYAEYARIQLISIGIDSSYIVAIPAEKVKINRTLTSALAFRNWLKLNNIEVKGINIVSMGTHARRTWMSYNKILDEKYQIGIISVPEHIHSRESKIMTTVRQTIGIIYYWFILLPY